MLSIAPFYKKRVSLWLTLYFLAKLFFISNRFIYIALSSLLLCLRTNFIHFAHPQIFYTFAAVTKVVAAAFLCGIVESLKAEVKMKPKFNIRFVKFLVNFMKPIYYCIKIVDLIV